MKTILVLDDEPNLRYGICAFLDDNGYSTLPHERGEDALKSVEEGTVDLAIVDLRLPEMDGEAFIMKARQMNPTLPIIIYTGSIGYSTPASLTAMNITQSDVLFKPMPDLSILLDHIERKLKRV